MELNFLVQKAHDSNNVSPYTKDLSAKHKTGGEKIGHTFVDYMYISGGTIANEVFRVVVIANQNFVPEADKRNFRR